MVTQQTQRFQGLSFLEVNLYRNIPYYLIPRYHELEKKSKVSTDQSS